LREEIGSICRERKEEKKKAILSKKKEAKTNKQTNKQSIKFRVLFDSKKTRVNQGSIDEGGVGETPFQRRREKGDEKNLAVAHHETGGLQ